MGAKNIEITEQVPASRKLGPEDAAALLQGARRLVTAKARKVRSFDLESDDRDEAVAAMLGPTGNLRAPTVKRGDLVLVGFDADTWEAEL